MFIFLRSFFVSFVNFFSLCSCIAADTHVSYRQRPTNTHLFQVTLLLLIFLDLNSLIIQSSFIFSNVHLRSYIYNWWTNCCKEACKRSSIRQRPCHGNHKIDRYLLLSYIGFYTFIIDNTTLLDKHVEDLVRIFFFVVTCLSPWVCSTIKLCGFTKLKSFRVDPRVFVATNYNPKIVGGILSYCCETLLCFRKMMSTMMLLQRLTPHLQDDFSKCHIRDSLWQGDWCMRELFLQVSF